MDFISEYFLNPILSNGWFNPVNSLVYGIVREHRRERQGKPHGMRLPSIDLNNPHQRTAFTFFSIGVILLLLFSAFGSSVPGAPFSVSGTGVIAFRQAVLPLTQLTWYDRSGKRISTLGEPGLWTNPTLSPDERRLAVERVDSQTNTRDIWVFDLDRGTCSRLTFDAAEDVNALWSPDGALIGRFRYLERKGEEVGAQRSLIELGETVLPKQITKARWRAAIASGLTRTPFSSGTAIGPTMLRIWLDSSCFRLGEGLTSSFNTTKMTMLSPLTG
jgi:hypothetical protein